MMARCSDDTNNMHNNDFIYHMSIKKPVKSGLLQTPPYPFWNVSLPWQERVSDLVSRLTLEEIQLQMARGGAGPYGGPAPAIPRLGIGPYNWNTECLRGDAEAVENATAFPQAIGLAASFSPSLLSQVGRASGMEVRAKHNDFVKRGIYADHTGASCFSPVVNIMRDPRWGRNQETYGEDPFLTGVMAERYVSGLQGNNSRYILTSAGCKHFDVHGGPENIPVSRFVFDAKVSDTDLRMTFLPAFKKCVEAGTYSVMCSYNSLNGVPTCANKELLTNILRKEWNFTGYVVSDEGAIENVISGHHYLNDREEVVAACVNAGTNLELSGNLPQPIYMSIVDAVASKKLSEDLVRERVKPLFYTRMRLGEFDPPKDNPFAQLSMSLVESDQHKQLAVAAAMKSFVLLKNADDLLPLKNGQFAWNRVAIIGPMADNVDQLFGDYSPKQDKSFTTTPLKCLKQWMYPDAKFGKVCQDGTPCSQYDKNLVPGIVNNTDLIFVLLGTGQAVESEERDRPDTELPGFQKELLLDVIQHSSGKAKIVLLLFSAGPLNISFADSSPRITAIMQCFFPSQATGDALFNVLVNAGKTSSPAGRLPFTWPKDKTQIQAMTNYSMEGRTYRYFKGDPLYPFGYGLSYTQFEYHQMEYTPSIQAGQNVDVTIYIRNIGNVESDEVVQCYISWNDTSLPVPQLQLVFFDRVQISLQEPAEVKAQILAESMAFWHDGKWIIKAGVMTLYCGGQQPNQKKQVNSNVLAGSFTIINSFTLNH